MGRKGKMLDKEITSKYLNEQITIKWYQPEAFTPLKHYHICIMQDGNDYFQLGRVATLSDVLHENGDIEDTIFVGIHYNERYDRQDKYHPKGTNNEAYTKFLVNEVVPYLDEELPTHQVGNCRALMGDSLAGTLALMTSLKYPNTFGKAIMQSPYIDEDIIRTVKDSSVIDQLSIYHTIGTEETVVTTTSGETRDFLTPNRQLKEHIKEHNSDYHYHEFNGNHTWKYWQKDLSNALITMFG